MDGAAVSASGESPSPGRFVIGLSIMALLGLAFGPGVTIPGSLLTWRSDNVLGLYDLTGWRFSNLPCGDGKIALALGIVVAVGLLLGLLLRSRSLFMVSVVASLVTIALAVYEIICSATRCGITGPGHGLYMVLGGGVLGFLCSLGCYLMVVENRALEPGEEGG